MSLIYGYSSKGEGKSEGSSDNNKNLESLVGTKTDDRSDDTAFGRIHKNKEDIVSSAASVVASTSKVVASVVSTVGQKTDAKTVDTAFGRIRKNKENIAIASSFVGSASSFEGESNLKGTQLSHASAITAHSNNLLELEDIVGYKDSSVGKLVPTVKLTSSLLGTKTDVKTVDTAFGRIQKNKEDVSDIENMLNNTMVEKVCTPLFYLSNTIPSKHYIKKAGFSPAWRPLDPSNPHIEHSNEIYLTSVRMNMKTDMKWVHSVAIYERKFHNNSSGKFVLIDPNDKGDVITSHSTNDLKQNKLISTIDSSFPLGRKMQDPNVFNAFYLDLSKKSGINSGAFNSAGRKLYIDLVFRNYGEFSDHWWVDKN